MSRKARSARGEVVDFDVLAIKEQLAQKPIPVGVDQRRRFIDEKDGIKTKEVIAPVVADALMVAIAAAAESEAAAVEEVVVDTVVEEITEETTAKPVKTSKSNK